MTDPVSGPRIFIRAQPTNKKVRIDHLRIRGNPLSLSLSSPCEREVVTHLKLGP